MEMSRILLRYLGTDMDGGKEKDISHEITIKALYFSILNLLFHLLQANSFSF